MFKKISLISLLCVSATYASDIGDVRASNVQAALSANLDVLEEKVIQSNIPAKSCLTSVGNLLLHSESFCAMQIADIQDKKQYDVYVLHQLQEYNQDIQDAVLNVLSTRDYMMDRNMLDTAYKILCEKMFLEEYTSYAWDVFCATCKCLCVDKIRMLAAYHVGHFFNAVLNQCCFWYKENAEVNSTVDENALQQIADLCQDFRKMYGIAVESNQDKSEYRNNKRKKNWKIRAD